MCITINKEVLPIIVTQPMHLLCFICKNNKLLIDFINRYILYIIKKLKTYNYLCKTTS